MNKEQTIDLPPPQNKILQKILRQHIPNKTVWAFGSRVEWKASETSDLDLVAHKCSGAEIADLKEALEESALHCSVDVLNWEDIPDSFRANIKKHYVVVQQNTVPEGWRVVKLGEFPIQIIDNDRGKNYPKEAEFYNSGHCLFLNTKNVTSKGFVFTETKFITKEKDSILGKGKLNRNDIVLTTRGTIGNIAFYDKKIPYENVRINSGMVIVRPDGIDPRFNFQLFKYLKTRFLNFSSGSAQPQIPIRDIKEVRTLLPPLSEQKAIAEVLSSLDDKIDLLQRQNKTLEGMAQTLFRKWFLEDAGDDWEVATVKDVCSKIQSGGTPSTKISEYYGGAINWYKTKELKDNFLLESETKITQEGLANSAANLFHENSIIIAIYAAPTVGRLGILANTAAFNQAACGLVADENKVCYEYLYLHFLSSRNTLLSMASGAAQQNLNVHFIQHFNIILPPQRVMKNFCGIVRPMFMKMKASQSQIRALEELRDALLPRLMSGVDRVK